ncbi:MAG: protein kinase [Deltaproteobacteria bacterium]|nr:protein kinase [Deltaproteobacteria bacterium]
MARSNLEPRREQIGDRYELLGLLGMGGMGSVYRVRDRELDEVVALKFLRRDLVDAPGMLERFRREVKLARRVTHVNVARTYDIGEHDGERFLTMEHVDGESLAKMLQREGPISSHRAIAIALALCAGLEAAHGAGVVHRDLKPDNVLLARDGRVVITDFGIARAQRSASQTAGVVGTAAYMAPEQVDGIEDVDARADLYALGAVLYEMITGSPAWTGQSFFAVAVARTREPPPDPRVRNPSVIPQLADVVLRCLARDREARFASARHVADALTLARASLPVDDAPPFGLAAMPARALRVAPAPGAGDTTIAVLPFAHGPGESDAFLAEALADDLVDALSLTPGVRVRPRSLVALHSTAGAVDPCALGRALDVRVVVEGSLRRSGDDVRITARLIHVADAFQLWARRFERPARDVLAIIDDLARAVAEALAVDVARATRQAAPDAEAVELHLRARQALRDAWSGFGDLSPAVTLFERALARAPDDPGVLSGYAMARARRLNYAPETDDAADVRALADRAVALAPHVGEAWLARATVLYITSDWSGAVTALRTALAHAPGLLKAHELLGNVLLEIGRPDDGIYRLETVLSLDPTTTTARWELARGCALAGRWDRVDVLLALPVERAEELAGRRVARARLNLWRGAARHEVNDIVGDRSDIMARHYDDALRGTQPPLAPSLIDAWLSRTLPGSRIRPLLFQFAAEVTSTVDPAAALDYVGRAVDERLFDLTWLDRCPLLACVRHDARFAALRARVVEHIAAIDAALDAPRPGP